MFIKTIPLATIALTGALAGLAHAQSGVLDVYTCYSSEKATREGGEDAIKAKILAAFGVCNQITDNSGIDLQVNPVGLEKVDYVRGAKSDSDIVGDVANNRVVDFQDRRKKWGADMVTFVSRTNGSGVAVGLKSTSNVLGKSLVGVVLMHEIGHNLGCSHGARLGGNKFTSYSGGQVWTGDDGVIYKSVMIGGRGPYGSVMSYLFSSPNLFVAGKPTGDPESADCVRFINEVMHESTTREKINPVAQGEWVILNRYSGKAVHKGGQTTANGAPITQWTNTGNDNMIWSFEPSPFSGWAHIKNKQSNKVIDAKRSLTNGTPLEQWSLSKFVDQQNFTLDHDASGFVRIRSKKGDKIMHNPRTLNQGAAISQWSYNGATHLQYELRFVP